MRYRKLARPPGDNVYNAQGGDYTFGNGANDFWVNVPDAVAQACWSRLYLFKGSWFLDTSLGVDWNNSILGKYTQNVRDLLIQATILGTEGVTSIASYSSSINRDTRQFNVSATVNTVYGPTTIEGPI